MKVILSILVGSSLLSIGSKGCMADADCEGNEVTMCCYMNGCTPSSSIDCSRRRLDFYQHLQLHDQDCSMDNFALEMNAASSKVVECESLGIHCIDYVTTFMLEKGAFENLYDVGELKEV